MNKSLRASRVVVAVLLFVPIFARADVALTDKGSATMTTTVVPNPITPDQKKQLIDANNAKRALKRLKHQAHPSAGQVFASPITPAQRQALRDANAAKRAAKKAKHTHGATSTFAFHNPGALANGVGNIQLIDSSGLKYFINSNVTFSTSSSASAAASEASYIAPVQASTSAGALVASSLSDMFDGYNGLCV